MKYFLQFVLGALGAVLALELLLRCLPASYGFSSPEISRQDPVVHYRPGASYTSSSGWLMRGAVSGRINSLGFSGPDIEGEQVAAALIGDSFVDALMIEPGLRVGDLLAGAQSPIPIVTMGVAGADLPDYIVTARWAVSRLPLKAVVFVISEDDLRSSVRPKLRGYWYEQSPHGLTVKQNGDGRLRNIIGSSRLGSYLIYNLKFGPQDIVRAFRRDKAPVQAVRPASDEITPVAAKRFIADAKRLADTGVAVLLVFQGDHAAIYAGKPDARRGAHLLMQLATKAGLRGLDLDPVFRREYARTQRKFDFDGKDEHWNEEGHRIAADAIRAELSSLRAEWPVEELRIARTTMSTGVDRPATKIR